MIRVKQLRLVAVLLAIMLIAAACGGGDETPEPSPTSQIVPTVETPTVEPTAMPTTEPTAMPTVEPTVEGTVEPTVEPTVEGTVEPTVEPTVEGTVEPTAEPTEGTASGTIVDVIESTPNRVTVITDDGQSLTLRVDENTQITVDGAEAVFTDLKSGMKIEATYDPSSSPLALTITATSPS